MLHVVLCVCVCVLRNFEEQKYRADVKQRRRVKVKPALADCRLN